MAFQEETRVFDVSRPNRVGPDPTSRPIIVGHQPMMPDPMVSRTNYAPATDTQSPPTPIHVSISNDEVPVPVTPAPEPLPPPSTPEPVQPEPSTLPEETPAPQPSESQEEPDHESNEDGFVATGPESLQNHPQNDEPQPGDDIHPDSIMPPIDENGGWQKEAAPLSAPRGAGPKRKWPRILGFIFGYIFLVVASFYLAIDMGVVQSDVKLPFHIFNNQKGVVVPAAATTSTNSAKTAAPPPAAITIPEGFTNYKLNGTSVSFAYPNIWGTPTVKADPGFSKRGGTNKSDGTYAYIVTFATNKDVEVALTSAKYLPAKRDALYYDFLDWCVGTNDNKVYKQTLHFNTDAGSETPGTVTCDQGPITDATKLDDSTIVQLKTSLVGSSADLYTKNLASNTDQPVIRIKDAGMKSGDDIKKVLATVQTNSSAP